MTEVTIEEGNSEDYFFVWMREKHPVEFLKYLEECITDLKELQKRGFENIIIDKR